MSKVSDVYEALITRSVAVLPNTYKRLSNPYKPEENSKTLLKNGYGVKIGSGSDTNRTMCPVVSIRRTFTIVLTKEYFALEDSGANKATTEKQILEDALLIIKDIDLEPTIGGTAGNAFYVGDSGIEYVGGNTDRFLKTEITINAEYFENIS